MSGLSSATRAIGLPLYTPSLKQGALVSLGSPCFTRSLATASDKDSSTTDLLLYPRKSTSA